MNNIEMKIRALDKMLDMREQLIVLQKNLGMHNSFDEKTAILIYDTDEFFETAGAVGGSVHAGCPMRDGDVPLTFSYKGAKFINYAKPEEYQPYKNRIRGINND